MPVKEKATDVDVLIVGAGPAGLMAAACLTRYGVRNIRIVDKRSTKVFVGQADGLSARSLEIFQALGIGSRILEEANPFGETCFWNPDAEGNIRRVSRHPSTIPGISRYQASSLHQGRIERVLLDKIAEFSTTDVTSGTAVTVERAVCPDQLILPDVKAPALSDLPEDRIIVRLRHLTEEEAQPAQFRPSAPDGLYRSNLFQDDALDAKPNGFPREEVLEEVRCRYVIGSDGARSWIRDAIGSQLVGESDGFFWGVFDGIPVTDFPDIRMRCAVHSAQNGSIMVIPRERGLVRIYVQIPHPGKGRRPDRAEVTPEKLLKAANSVLAPYTIKIPKIEWYTCYEVGQRLATKWSWNDRIFIAGDACHTHSPKAGQGMNVSMADTFNLSWKLAHVLQNKANTSILKTYEFERAHIAHQLIQFDKKFARLFSGKPSKDVLDESGVSMEEFQRTLKKGSLFTSGTSVDYPPSVLISKTGLEIRNDLSYNSKLAKNLPIGTRLHDYHVVSVADALPYYLSDLACADGRWKVLIFGGDVTRHSECRLRLDNLCEFLTNPGKSPVMKYTPKGRDLDSVFNILTILASARTTIECEDFDEILRPTQSPLGFRAYKKIFADDESYYKEHGRVYEGLGIDPKFGALVVLRPDQHVSLVTEIDDHTGIATFFDSFMVPAVHSAVNTKQPAVDI